MSLVIPEATESEAVVLGTILADDAAIGRIDHLLSAEDFYDPNYRQIYKTAIKMYRNRESIDITSVGGRLKQAGWLDNVGGFSGLLDLANGAVTSLSIVTHAKIVAERSIQRKILSAAKKIAETTQDTQLTTEEMVNKVEEQMTYVSRSSMMQAEKLSLVRIQDYVEEAINSRPAKGQIQGLSTGFYEVDDLTKGFVPGELMILSGHTSHGKTQLATNITYRVASTGKPVLFVTMEMTKVEMTQRLLAIADDNINETLPIHFQSRTDLAYTDVSKLVERAKEQGVELVVIDHLHYFSRSIENSTAEISKIVKEFKEAAIKNNMPIILICHVRKMDTKKRPSLQDIRDSSLIAQDSDLVLMVWRDTSVESETIDEVEVLILKNRNRGLHARRKLLYSNGPKLTEQRPPGALDYNPDATVEGGSRDDIDFSW